MKNTQLAEALKAAIPVHTNPREKLFQEIREVLDDLKVESDPLFAGIQLDLQIDESVPGVRRLCCIRLVPVDQAADGSLSRRIAR